MSVTQFRNDGPASAPVPVTFQTIQEKKQTGRPITALTAYDYATARLVDEAGIDLILVGDSLAMVVMGYDNTLPVTVDEMLHHTRAVRRAVRRAIVAADMPWGSYHLGIDDAVANAVRFVKEAGAQAVKIEGGASRAELVERLTSAEIPVIGHLGLTPQSVHRMGGYKVQGKSAAAINELLHDAHTLESAGAVHAGARRHAARSRRPHHGGSRHSDHRHRRGTGLRWTDSRLPRPGESQLFASRRNSCANMAMRRHSSATRSKAIGAMWKRGRFRPTARAIICPKTWRRRSKAPVMRQKA